MNTFSQRMFTELMNQHGCIVLPLKKSIYTFLNALVQPTQTDIPQGMKVKEHKHKFVSFYLAKNNALQFNQTIYEMPPFALVIVLPQRIHPWINPGKSNVSVGDLSPEHGLQELIPI